MYDLIRQHQLLVCTCDGCHVGGEEKKHFSPLVISCKFFEKKFYCVDHQRGRLLTWLPTKNTCAEYSLTDQYLGSAGHSMVWPVCEIPYRSVHRSPVSGYCNSGVDASFLVRISENNGSSGTKMRNLHSLQASRSVTHKLFY